MVANPNSNLVFDFPDPTPRFDFDDTSPKKTSPQTKKGLGSKRFGKKKFGSIIGTNNNKAGSSSPTKNSNSSSNNKASDESPSRHSVGGNSYSGTATTASLNTSLTSISPSGSRNSSPLQTRSSSGDLAGGPPQVLGSGSTSAAYSVPHFDFNTTTPTATKLNLPTIGNTTINGTKPRHARNVSSAGSASGYISEVSEFSFDRVTVATNESGITGQSSHISWNFMNDGGVMEAVGMGDKFTPYTGDTNATTGNNNKELLNTGTRTQKRGSPPGHQKKTSSSTFSNVSISDDEMDNIPFTGIVNQYLNDSGDHQSVMSELSERTSSRLNPEYDAVREILRDGMESCNAKRKEQENIKETKAAKVVNSKLKLLTMIKAEDTNDKNTNSNSNKGDNGSTDTTAKSSGAKSTLTSSTTTNMLQNIQSNYSKFKTSRNNGQKESTTILSSIIEDLQFCGLYLCGIDTTDDDDENNNGCSLFTNNKGGCGGGGKGTKGYEDSMKKKKEERKKETEDTFLGKVIKCGNNVPGCGDTFCGVVEFA